MLGLSIPLSVGRFFLSSFNSFRCFLSSFLFFSLFELSNWAFIFFRFMSIGFWVFMYFISLYLLQSFTSFPVFRYCIRSSLASVLEFPIFAFNSMNRSIHFPLISMNSFPYSVSLEWYFGGSSSLSLFHINIDSFASILSFEWISSEQMNSISVFNFSTLFFSCSVSSLSSDSSS